MYANCQRTVNRFVMFFQKKKTHALEAQGREEEKLRKVFVLCNLTTLNTLFL
jgi:hypothetical protein